MKEGNRGHGRKHILQKMQDESGRSILRNEEPSSLMIRTALNGKSDRIGEQRGRLGPSWSGS